MFKLDSEELRLNPSILEYSTILIRLNSFDRLRMNSGIWLVFISSVHSHPRRFYCTRMVIYLFWFKDFDKRNGVLMASGDLHRCDAF